MSETATATQDAKTNGNGNQQLATLSPELRMAEQAVAIEERKFALAQRQANVYAQSSLVPQHYRGNIGNVLIAQNMAKRMNADLLMVMQNLYVVHGNPGWSSQYLIATFNANGKFSALRYRFRGEPNEPEWGCQAYCTEAETGDEIAGTWVTWDMANKEGWVNKNGSKWKTMPEQMFRYRSAAFLIRTTAPEIAMGLLTKEELEDVYGGTNGNAGIAEQTRNRVAELKKQLEAAPEVIDVEAETELDDTPPPDTDEAAEASNAEFDELDALRANVQAAFDGLTKGQQKDVLAGKPFAKVADASVNELNQLLIDIRKAQE